MNIFLHKKQLLLLFLAFVYFPLSGQVDTVLQTQPGEAVELDVFHYRGFSIGLGTTIQPANGQLIGPTLIAGSTEIYKYTYQPNPGFIGEDTFTFTRLTCFQPSLCLETIKVTINVRHPEVTANEDIAFAMLDAGPVSIDVLDNDESDGASLSILNVPMVNNGTVTIGQDGQLYFQPDPGFEGIASFNYNACNDFGICDLATVNVVVSGVTPGASDTLRIFTGVNERIPIITPNDYALESEPENGVFDQRETIPYYYPEKDFIGADYISFSYGDFSQTIEVTVLDIKRNSFLTDDQAYVTPSRTVEIDVFANDLIEGNPCLENIEPAKYGTVFIDPENPGVLSYKAPAGFVGVDEFRYSVLGPDCSGAPETATVSVFVSNYEPSSTKYAMSTPKRTPLVIGYYVPIKNFDLQIKSKPRMGEVLFLEGEVDTLIMGKQITGHNLMIYMPANQLHSGLDEFEITYCLEGPINTNTRQVRTPSRGGLFTSDRGGNTNTSSTGCSFQKDVKISVNILNIGSGEAPMCFGDCIWAGDTNFDGVVNLEDLLPIGLKMGDIGVAREAQAFNEWYGQDATDWSTSPDENVTKHIDTDGDRFISASDTNAIVDYYGRTHSMTNAKIPTHEYQIYLKGKSSVRPGDMMELEVFIGNEDAPAVDLYGFTFNLPYNPKFFKPGTMEIEFLPNSWITYNSPTLDMKNNNGNGLLATAFTRTNQEAITGFGKVAIMRGVVEDIIVGIRDEDGKLEIEFDDDLGAVASTGSGMSYGVNVAPFTLTIDLNEEAEEPKTSLIDQVLPERSPVSNGELLMYPNPAKDELNFYLNGGKNIERIQLFSLSGKLLMDSGRLNDRFAQMEVNRLVNGLYIAKIFSEEEVISKRVQVTH